MRHPSERFITSLIIQGKNDDEIREEIANFGLPELGDMYTDYLINLRLSVVPAIPKGYTGFRDEDRAYLRSIGVDGLVHPDAGTAKVLSILEKPFVRRDALLGMLGRIQLDNLAEHL